MKSSQHTGASHTSHASNDFPESKRKLTVNQNGDSIANQSNTSTSSSNDNGLSSHAHGYSTTSTSNGESRRHTKIQPAAYEDQVARYWEQQFEQENDNDSQSVPFSSLDDIPPQQNAPTKSHKSYESSHNNGNQHGNHHHFHHQGSTGSVGSNTTLESTSSIWSRLEEDEQRMARLRSRLSNIRKPAGSSSQSTGSTDATSNGFSISPRHDRSIDNTMAKVASDTKRAPRSRSMTPPKNRPPTQEEARQLRLQASNNQDYRLSPSIRRLRSMAPPVPIAQSSTIPNNADNLNSANVTSVQSDWGEASMSSIHEPDFAVVNSAAVNSTLHQQTSALSSSSHSLEQSSPAQGPSTSALPGISNSSSNNTTGNNAVTANPTLVHQTSRDLDPEKARLLASYGTGRVTLRRRQRLDRAMSNNSASQSSQGTEAEATNHTLTEVSPRTLQPSIAGSQAMQDMQAKLQQPPPSQTTRAAIGSSSTGNNSNSESDVIKEKSQIDADLEAKREQQEWENRLVREARRSVNDESADGTSSTMGVPPGNHRPGAFSVAGTTSTDETEDQSVNNDVGDKPSSSMPVAAMVVEDFEREELTERERQLKLQEEALAARMAELQAYEEELRRRRQQLELQACGSTSAITPSIVQAEVVGRVVQDEEDEEWPLRGGSVDRYDSAHSMPRSTNWSSMGSRLGATIASLAGSSLADETSVSSKTSGYKSTGSATKLKVHSNERVDIHEAYTHLGPGPVRFALQGERSLEEQLVELSPANRRIYRNLKQRWEDRKAKNSSRGSKKDTFDLPIEYYLRFLRMYERRDGSFAEEKSWNSIRKIQRRFVQLNVYSLENQLASKTLFPVPGLRTREGHDMFYMRPSRYFPGKTTTRMVIDNLCYVMNTMLEKESSQKNGIGFIACMDNWKMRNFEVNYCYQFMMGLQGFMIPVKTQLFLIVNPPAWFGVVWRIMKPMLAPSFRKRVKICNERKISKYLEPGYETFLPDDMTSGQAPTDQLVEDFIAFRKFAEQDVLVNGEVYDAHDDSISEGQNSLDDHSFLRQQSFRSNDSDRVKNRAAAGSFSSSDLAGVTPLRMDFESCSGSSMTGDDDASIEADIHNDHLLEDEDMKQASSSAPRSRFGF